MPNYRLNPEDGTKAQQHTARIQRLVNLMETDPNAREAVKQSQQYLEENNQIDRAEPMNNPDGDGGSAENSPLDSRKPETHLILTVGTNALPVWVAWYHLKEELKNPKVTFVYTQETEETVGCLKKYFECDSVPDVCFVDISRTAPGNPKAVRGTIEEFLEKLQTDAIHVHYTGGTQVMGVETVLTIAKKKRGNVDRSYLNVRSGSVPTIVKQDGNSIDPKDARHGICPDIKKIAELNGFNLQSRKCEIPEAPNMEDCKEIVSFAGDSKIWLQRGAWAALDGSLKKIAVSDGSKRNHKVFRDVEIRPREGNSHFKLDVVAVLGYQVIVVSCIGLSKMKSEVKLEAIKAYHQAKQLGGDEARAIVLCGLSKSMSKKLQDELYKEIGSEDVPLQIWGNNTWADLDNKFCAYLTEDLVWRANSEAIETSEERAGESEQGTQSESQMTNLPHQMEPSARTGTSQNHLVFTVGTNALPIWIAWKYLKTELQNPKVSFVYTKETQKIVKGLKEYFKCDGAADFACILVEDPGNPAVIRKAIQEKLSLEGASVHVHYTGGTQAMGVETVLAVKKGEPNDFKRSYLNARGDSVPTIVEQNGSSIGPEDARQKICPDIKRIAELNGFEVSDKDFSLNYCPTDPQNFACDDLDCFESAKLETASVILENFDSISDTISEVRKNLCPPERDPDNIWENCILRKLDRAYIEDKDKRVFLHGIWLEYAALAVLKHALEQIKCERKRLSSPYIRDNYALYRGVHGRKKVDSNEHAEPFELDVVAVLGYQVLVISCTTSSDTRTARKKAVEAYLRAKQLGGDEARVIMLCDLGDDQRQNLEEVVKDDMGSKDEPLQVWGKNTWAGLSDKFKEYLKDLYWKSRD